MWADFVKGARPDLTGFRLEFDLELEALPGDRDVRDVRGCPVDRHLIIDGGHLEDMVVGQPGLPIPTETPGPDTALDSRD